MREIRNPEGRIAKLDGQDQRKHPFEQKATKRTKIKSRMVRIKTPLSLRYLCFLGVKTGAVLGKN